MPDDKIEPREEQVNSDVENEGGVESDILPAELAEQIPSKVREKVTSFFMSSRASSDPIGSKIKSEHITKAMDLAKDNSDKNFEYAKGTRRYQFVIFLIAMAVAIFLIVFLIEKQKTEILSPLLAALLGFASGFGIGRTNR